MTAQDIIREIKNGHFTNDDLNAIAKSIQFARSQLVHEVKRDLSPGVTMSFRDRLGIRVMGTVESVKIKNAIVRTSRGRYRVPCNMLEMA